MVSRTRTIQQEVFVDEEPTVRTAIPETMEQAKASGPPPPVVARRGTKRLGSLRDSVPRITVK